MHLQILYFSIFQILFDLSMLVCIVLFLCYVRTDVRRCINVWCVFTKRRLLIFSIEIFQHCKSLLVKWRLSLIDFFCVWTGLFSHHAFAVLFGVPLKYTTSAFPSNTSNKSNSIYKDPQWMLLLPFVPTHDWLFKVIDFRLLCVLLSGLLNQHACS